MALLRKSLCVSLPCWILSEPFWDFAHFFLGLHTSSAHSENPSNLDHGMSSSKVSFRCRREPEVFGRRHMSLSFANHFVEFHEHRSDVGVITCCSRSLMTETRSYSATSKARTCIISACLSHEFALLQSFYKCDCSPCCRRFHSCRWLRVHPPCVSLFM